MKTNELISKLSQETTNYQVLKNELNDKENELVEIKRDLLGLIIKEFNSGGAYQKLIWNFAVDKKYGKDIDLITNVSLLEKYVKMYIEEIYCFKMDGIYMEELK